MSEAIAKARDAVADVAHELALKLEQGENLEDLEKRVDLLDKVATAVSSVAFGPQGADTTYSYSADTNTRNTHDYLGGRRASAGFTRGDA